MENVVYTSLGVGDLRRLFREEFRQLLDESPDSASQTELTNLDKKLNQLIELAPVLEALGRVLVRRKTATERAGLHRNTISSNSRITKFEQVGHRRTYIELGDISVVRKRLVTKRRTRKKGGGGTAR